jgi:membrane associated rhomboid family serine protease
MFPLSDINPTHRFPIATIGLIGINVAVYFLFQATLNEREAYLLAANWAAVPAEISRGIGPEQTLDIFRAMFMHGSLTHLLGNMLYLWIFGDNLEDRLGIPLYLAFYFACGLAATLAQVMVDPASPIPMLGASGAIAGVLGGYLIMFPGVRVRGLVIHGLLRAGGRGARDRGAGPVVRAPARQRVWARPGCWPGVVGGLVRAHRRLPGGRGADRDPDADHPNSPQFRRGASGSTTATIAPAVAARGGRRARRRPAGWGFNSTRMARIQRIFTVFQFFLIRVHPCYLSNPC